MTSITHLPETMPTHNIGEALQGLRTSRSQTTAQLYASVHRSLPHLSLSRFNRYVLGYAHPEWSEVVAIAQALGTTPEALVGVAPAARPCPVPAPPRPAEAPPPPSAAPAAPTAPNAIYPEAPSAIPDRGTSTSETYRRTLSTELHTAREALTIPKLPPQCWAAWRRYEKLLIAALQRLCD